ncbi:MAG: chemotaxis-specific protein-glutamate methyltransferase CheB [Planctomycetia bacterium]|nr:chemotaxis-specific protein-glutamate methyltransferase CheB [Planctomycetia bacterium]
MRALVVDDSKPSRSIVARALQELNFSCSEAGNGVEALAALASGGRPDLVTVNWHMPVMDGVELVRRLRADPAYRGLPILMIATEHDQERIALARAAGINDYLAKPFTAAALARKLVDLGLVPRELAMVGGRGPIGVLICDDSATIRGILTATLGADPDLKIVGTAVNGATCLDAIAAAPPDLVLLDVEMPVMDGLTALREIRKRFGKLPVIMFSSLTERGAKATVDALLAGANDYVAKPAGLNADDVAARIRSDVIGRIKSLVSRGTASMSGRGAAAGPNGGGSTVLRSSRPARNSRIEGVVVAVSTGGPTALAEVLPAFVPEARVPIIIVQHMPAFFTAALAERLAKVSGLPVREATEGESAKPGEVLLAPGGRHVELVGDAVQPRIRLTDDPPENSCRPSADVLFRSAVRLWGGGTLGVVLTGMGRDGLAGSRAIVAAGGGVIAQDEFSSVVWGMPGEVVRAGLADAVLPLSQVGVEIGLRLKRRGG